MILNKIIIFFKRDLDKKEKKNLITIQFVFILSSLIELIGILSILPI